MNFHEQEISDVLDNLLTQLKKDSPLINDLGRLAQLIDIRTDILRQLHSRLVLSDLAIQGLVSELESAEIDMEDMDDFIGILKRKLTLING